MPASRRFPLLLIGAFWPCTWSGARPICSSVSVWSPGRRCSWLGYVSSLRAACCTGSCVGGVCRRRPGHNGGRPGRLVLLLSCGNGGVTLAEHAGVASGVAALAVATVPLFTLVFGLLFGHRNSRLEWAGIALGLVGIGMLNMGSNLQASPMGAALILFAAAAWAFGSVWSKTLPLPQGRWPVPQRCSLAVPPC